MSELENIFDDYVSDMASIRSRIDFNQVSILLSELQAIRKNGKSVFVCGNGGSASNANHIANDFFTVGLKAFSLTSNGAILTCQANDHGYECCFSKQIDRLATQGDLLIALSGSGNSANILRAVESSKKIPIKTFGIIGFDGGKLKALVDHPIHFACMDMQKSEDFQTILGHILMKALI